MSSDVRIDPQRVDAPFLADVIALLVALPDDWVITCGWRDVAVEAAGYAKWIEDPSQPKYTNPTNSAHVGGNFPDGCARAVDVTLVRDGKDVWDYKDAGWRALVAAVLAHPRLHGLDSIGDTDHVEKLHWQRDKSVAA
jgi:hypothetical protein